jgi:D-alanyl-lipoteichoic acid acyltransferase DltB (MBOAT superfamily)
MAGRSFVGARHPAVNFVSFEFLGFLGAVYVFHWLLPQERARKWLLTVASYLFYAAWDWRFCFLMLFVTVNAFAAGHLLSSIEHSGRKLILAASIGVDLALLAFFKYYNFFADNAAVALADLGFPGTLPILQIVLPVGISFYTFHAISYVVDIYRGKVQPEASFVNVALYISFFPQLIAGPIVRATFIMPQIRRRPFSRSQQAIGIRLLLRGFIYKAMIADMLAQVADPVFAHLDQYDPHALLTAVVVFYGQIYFDFAGYSSMAIGTARLFGYRFPRNFDYPYSSASVTEFWRRWHMSLSFWLRDYVYIPLGGNRGGRLAVYRNLMMTMLLGGLWHGAAWNYVIWGLLHGFGLCANKAWVTVRPCLPVVVNWQSDCWRTVAIVLTQLWIMVAWVFFRCDSVAEANSVLGSIVGLHPHPGAAIVPLEPWIVLIIAIDHTLGSGALRWSIPRGWARALSWGGMGMLLALTLATMPLVQRPFIYFQF